MQFRAAFNQIAKEIRKKSPSFELIEEILSISEDPDICRKYYDSGGWNEDPVEGTKVLIGAIYDKDEEKINKLVENSYNNYEDLVEIALLAFNIAAIRRDPDTVTYLVHEYHFGWKQVSATMINLLFSFIENKELNISKDFYINNKDKVDSEALMNKAVYTFNETVRSIRDAKKIKYDNAVFIKDLFEIPTGMTYPEMYEEYEYHIAQKNYLLAAEISKEFSFPQNLVLQASFNAFKVAFESFKHKVITGEYKNTTDLGPTDPYKTVKQIIKEYNLLDLSISNELHKTYIKRMAEIVSNFLKEINYKEKFDKINLQQKIIFSANIISDFKLTTGFFDTDIVVQTNEIITKILNLIDSKLENLENVKTFHGPLMKLNEIYTVSKEKIRKLAGRIFDIFLFEEDLNKAVETFDVFKLNARDLLPAIIEKCKKLLEEDKIKSLKEIVEHFDIERDLMQNEKFTGVLYQSYERNINIEFYEKALSLLEIFNIPKERLVSPLLLKVDSKLYNLKYDEVKKLLDMFGVEIKTIRKQVLEFYDRIVYENVEMAKKLREDFGLSIFDVGFFKWLLREFFKIGIKRG